MRNLESALAAADKQANRTSGTKTKSKRPTKSNGPSGKPADDTRVEIEIEEMGEGLKVDDSELKAEIEKIRQDVHNTHMTGEERSSVQALPQATERLPPPPRARAPRACALHT